MQLKFVEQMKKLGLSVMYITSYIQFINHAEMKRGVTKQADLSGSNKYYFDLHPKRHRYDSMILLLSKMFC